MRAFIGCDHIALWSGHEDRMRVYSNFLWMEQQEKLSASIIAVSRAVALGAIVLRHRG